MNGQEKIITRETPTGTLYFNEATHRFWKEKDGKKLFYTSVTGYTGVIDKPGLPYWAVDLAGDFLLEKLSQGLGITELDILQACQQHTIKKREAGNIGTEIHDWIDKWLNGENPDIPENPNVVTGITAFLDYQRTNKIQWLEGEQIVCSDEYGFAGKYDRKAIIEGKRYMVDFKSSNNNNSEYAFQTGLYQIAEEEITGEVFDGRLVVRFAKETEVEYFARMEKKNAKRVKLGKKPNPIPPYKVFEPIFYHDNEEDKKAAIACITIKNRLKVLDSEKEEE